MRTLLDETGAVLENPFLVALVEAAPSATDLFEHVCHFLGWEENLGYQMKASYKLKENFSKVWAEIKKSDKQPADAMFKFTQPTSAEYEFFNQVCPLIEVSANFGECEISTTNLPFFALEFKTDTRSTIDGDGQTEQTLKVRPYDDLVVYPEEIFRHALSDNQISFHICENGELHVHNDKISVRTKLVICSKLGERYPSLSKIIQIDKLTGDRLESIRIILRKDTAKTFADNIGILKYSKTIEISPQVKLTLVAYGKISHNLSCWFDYEKHNLHPITFSFSGDFCTQERDQNILHRCMSSEPLRKASYVLTDIYHSLMHSKESIPLNQVAGLNIIRSPFDFVDSLKPKQN